VSGRETGFCFCCLLYSLSRKRFPTIGKPGHINPVNDEVFLEHGKGSHPTGIITIKAAVYDHKFFSFAMAGYGYDFIIVTFVVAVPPRSDFVWPLIHHDS
jgi:hypothetical protein